MGVVWKKLAFSDDAPGAHKDTHDPIDGTDKLDTATPVKVGSANAIGGSHSLARANHVHEREHAVYTHPTTGSCPQAPKAHESTHVAGGSDDIDSALAIAAMANLSNGKIWKGNASNRPTEIDVPIAKSIATGSYTGNGVADRQITVGFQCKAVFILTQATFNVDFFPVLNATGADTLDIGDTDHVDDVVKPYLHATDGFVLGATTNEANQDTWIYKYIAFG